MLSIIPIGSTDFTAPIFTIRFTGIPGITILTSMILTIIHRGIALTGHTDGTMAGEATGIHPITAGGMATHHTTTGTSHIMAITDGAIPTIHGTEEATGMLTPTITGTVKEGQPAQVHTKTTTGEEYLHQLSAQPHPLPERAVTE